MSDVTWLVMRKKSIWSIKYFEQMKEPVAEDRFAFAMIIFRMEHSEINFSLVQVYGMHYFFDFAFIGSFFIFRRASSQVPEKVASTNCDHTIDLAINKHVSKTFFVQYHVVVL